MPATLKSVAKALLPPIVTEAIRPRPVDPYLHAAAEAGGYFTLPDGARFYLRDTHADREVCRQVFIYEDYALRRTRRLASLMAFHDACANPVIVDAGANIGAASRYFSRTLPKAKIVAVEPDPGNFALLSRNVERSPSILPVQAAIASSNDRLVLVDPGEGGWAMRTAPPQEAQGVTVDALTIEEVFEHAGGGEPFILKIDIEGAEGDLFSRQSALFDRFPLVIVELHDWMLPNQGTSRSFLAWHLAARRDFVFSGENVFSISSALPLTPRHAT